MSAQRTEEQVAGPAPWVSDVLPESELRAAVLAANVPTLLMVVFHATGDERWLAPPYAPTRGKGLSDHDTGGLPDDVQDEIREAAVQAILTLQSGAAPALPSLTPELATRMMGVYMGEAVEERHGELLAAEITRRIAPGDASLAMPAVAVPEGFKAIVIGSGVAGIMAAQQLEEMGVDYQVVSKHEGPGGTWWMNTYPGAGVDTPSYLYSFYFAQNRWKKHFELQAELQGYFADVIERVVSDPARIRYGTEVIDASFVAERTRWEVTVENPDGSREVLEADAVLAGVGSLNRASVPDLPGIDDFAGSSFHSSAWPETLDLTGKRVAIVGTGASAMQIAPAIAERVERLTIFQRSPGWIAPFDKFTKPIPAELSDLLGACGFYAAWYWARLFWQFGDKVIEALRVDPGWSHPERSVNRTNDGHREFFTRYLREKLGDRADLVAKTLPDYPPYGKRILLDNGWFDTLLRDDVELVSEAVARVTTGGLITESGDLHEADVVIWATGFDTSRFVSSLDVHGVGGRSLREAWDDDDPRAYLGVSTPGFPNFFTLGGPNSFPGSGSFMFFMEVQMRYIRRLLTEMFDRGGASLVARETATAAYNDRVDDMHSRMVWTHPGMRTYYRNSKGRIVFVMPFLNVEYWEMTKRADLENYEMA